MEITEKAVLWGGSGQAKVVKPILDQMGISVGIIFDRRVGLPTPFDGIALIHSKAALTHWINEQHEMRLGFVAAIGGNLGKDRLEIDAKLTKMGLNPITVIHNRAHVASSSSIGDGCQILAMATVSEEVVIGRQVIVNTSASVDHECIIGDGVHIMPGAILAGCVNVGDCAMIGSNATVLPRVTIGEFSQIGAGAVVTRNVAPYATVVGIPARPVG